MAQFMLRKATEDEILREQAIAREKFENDMISIKCHMREAEEARDEMQKQAEEAQREAKAAQREAEEAQREAEETRKQAEEYQIRLQMAQKESWNNLRDAAAKLKARGMSADEISDITSLSAEEIEGL